MGKIASFQDAREKKNAKDEIGKVWKTGEAVCMECKHEWVQVMEVLPDEDNLWFDCPKCEVKKGHYKFVHGRKGQHWVCSCDNTLFHVTPEGVYCPNCGDWQLFPKLRK